MNIIKLGLVNYQEAYALQEHLAAAVATGAVDGTLLLLEHPPVYTIGSGGSESNLLDPSVKAVRVNRGGDVTYHGPGQLVGYPIIDLSRRGRDLHRYLRFLEELLIRTVAEFGITAQRVSGKTGVWTGSPPAFAKLAAIGIGVRRWVTMHGFSLNVSTDLSRFTRINPCGIVACPVTSFFMEGAETVTLEDVSEFVAMRFETLLEQLLPVDFSGIINT